METDMVTRDEYYEESENEYDDVRELDESSIIHVHKLSYSDTEIDRGQVMDIRMHAPL